MTLGAGLFLALLWLPIVNGASYGHSTNIGEGLNTIQVLTIGLALIGRPLKSHAIGRRRFISKYGTEPLVVCVLWRLLQPWKVRVNGCRLKHLLWALTFMKSYNTESTISSSFHPTVDEKTYRKWIWYMLEGISRLTSKVVRHAFKFRFGKLPLLTQFITDQVVQQVQR